jgi:hypothetical protein
VPRESNIYYPLPEQSYLLATMGKVQSGTVQYELYETLYKVLEFS